MRIKSRASLSLQDLSAKYWLAVENVWSQSNRLVSYPPRSLFSLLPGLEAHDASRARVSMANVAIFVKTHRTMTPVLLPATN
jgi:hypothetical protein